MKVSKKIGIILVSFVLVIGVFLILPLLFDAPIGGDQYRVKRDLSTDPACIELRNNYNCNISNWEEVKVQHQDIGDSKPKDYTLKELCNLQGFNETLCWKRCNCEFT